MSLPAGCRRIGALNCCEARTGSRRVGTLSCPDSFDICCPVNGSCSGGVDINATPSCSGQLSIACQTGYGNCGDESHIDGCETNLNTSTEHCGTGCCSMNHITPKCSGGVCNGTCQANYGDCDSDKRTNGCETDLRNTNSHCGTCDTDCNGDVTKSGVCSSKVCNLTACAAGLLNCNRNPSDGCEVNSATDVTNCGACANDCGTSVLHVVTVSCDAGECSYTGGCAAGFADCDGDKSNGCEVNLKADPDNCNACDMKCTAPASGTPVCFDGACDFTCPAMRCGDLCSACCVDGDCPLDPDDKCKNPTCSQPATAGASCGFTEKECVQLECQTQVVCLPGTGECKSQPVSGGTCGATGCCDPPGSMGSCVSGVCGCPLKDCTNFAGACVIGVCRASDGECAGEYSPNGAMCNLADKCMIDTQCSSGTCVGVPKECASPALCKVATCEATTGDCSIVADAPAGAVCSTGDPCVQNETCNGSGACLGTSLPDSTPCSSSSCGSGGVCTSGACVCQPASADLAVADAAINLPDLDGTGAVDLSAPSKGADKSGCSVASSPVEFGWMIFAMFGLRVRRRR